MTLPFFTPRKITTDKHDRIPKEKYALFALSRLRFLRSQQSMIADINDWTLPLRCMHGPNDFVCMAVIILV